MSYKKGYEEGYKAGLMKGSNIALSRYKKGIEFAGAVRKKQSVFIEGEIGNDLSKVEIPKPTCGFSAAYAGQCKSTKVLDNGQCENHQDKCCMCGELATQSCSHAGQFVCGAPICDSCNHYPTHR